ncbi:hypothetical protein [Aerosakkonema sp. BLCC-F183]|uniref:hypothetical protein n=1 Tax=Aerosakkonema sp. BLCC-F183 TaxID=3342834 RepID=UPI0035BBCB4E
MTIPKPNLDDRTYASLIEEARSLIPIEYPEWTDHNPSDTGILLLELIAWLTEMLLYRINQIPDQNYAVFLDLLNSKTQLSDSKLIDKQNDTPIANLSEAIQQTVVGLRKRYRAVTREDFEQLILTDWNESQEAKGYLPIKQVLCLDKINLDNLKKPKDTTLHHVSLVIVPQWENDPPPSVSAEVKNSLEKWLNKRRLLTTRLHICEPKYVPLSIQITLSFVDGADIDSVKSNAVDQIKKFFHPYDSGDYWKGRGWRLGQTVYHSELYKLLNDLPGVKAVKTLKLQNAETKLKKSINSDTQDLEVENIEGFASQQIILIDAEGEYSESATIKTVTVHKKILSLEQPIKKAHNQGRSVILTGISLDKNQLIKPGIKIQSEEDNQ